MSNYINIRQVLDNLLVHPLLQDLSLERVVNYTVDFIRIVGMPPIFEDKIEVVTIRDYRALLPCDFHEMIQVRKLNSNEVFIYNSDSFLGSTNKVENNNYKLQGNIIYTSIKDIDLELSYRAMPVDIEGYPLIPDNSSFIKALELYIKKQVFTIQFDLGRITAPVLQNTQQEYSWAVGQCQSDLIRPTVDEMQTITNMWNSLLPNINRHNKGFNK